MDDSPLDPLPDMDDGGDIPEVTSLPLEEEPKPRRKPEPVQTPPALTIHIQSWATPVLSILMLLVGLAAGFYARPFFDTPLLTANPTPTAEIVDVAPTQAPAAAQEQSPTQSDQAQADQQQQLMDLVVSQTRHFQGDENAPVTLIEFSDFQ